MFLAIVVDHAGIKPSRPLNLTNTYFVDLFIELVIYKILKGQVNPLLFVAVNLLR